MKLILKKDKDIYQGVAKDLSLPVELVQTIGSHAWKKLKSEFNNLDHHEIYMLGLGSFRMRRLQIEKDLVYLELRLENLEMSKYIETKEQLEERRSLLTTKIDKLNKRREDLIRITEEKKEFKINRDGKTNGDIQEQEFDLGRNEE